MKTTLCVLALLMVPAIASATEQVPDILYVDGLRLRLEIGWGHPSPLETYYYQSRLTYPFKGSSTGNYRGHVATWKIVEGKLYLAGIGIERYEPNKVDPSIIERVVEPRKISEYGVKSRSGPPSEDGKVLADWFNGVLDCYTISEGNRLARFYHVRDGSIVDSQIISGGEYKIVAGSAGVESLTPEQKKKRDMLLLSKRYVTYYFRLSEQDTMELKGKDCRLDTGWSRLSPIFGRYGNDHLKWPYNWGNSEKCGAPHCQWLIRDDRLYLTKVELYSGLLFDTIDTETLNLGTLFPGEVVDGEVPANWVSGVYLVEHGDMVKDPKFPGLDDYKVTELTYLRIADGAVTESYTVPSDFDRKNMPADTDPGLRQIIEDYELPSAVEW